MKRFVLLVVVVGVLSIALPCFAMGSNPGPAFNSEMVAKTPVDECFSGIGEPYKPGPTCGAGEIPKANESYLWGMTKAGDRLWFGTGANMMCLMQAYGNYDSDAATRNSYENNMWVCEFNEGQYLQTQGFADVPPIFGDYRPPKIYTYALSSGLLTDVTAQLTDPAAVALIRHTYGLRSAAAIGNLVFLGGPVALGKGINLFVFDAGTGALIGARTLPQYQNIRKWLALNGALYAAVADEAGGGKILRWTGTPTAPFAFQEVGAVDGSATEIAAHDGRIFVGTWPNRNEEKPSLAGIWMSPAVPSEGLTAAHLNAWQKVWTADEYEPDPVVATTYGCGPMASYGGYLYWGTMHVPLTANTAYSEAYGHGALEFLTDFLRTSRATSIFRGRNFAGGKQVTLLYGDATMSVYDGRRWRRQPNNMGGAPGLYGRPGFDNWYNNYTWSMAVYEGNLFVGTMDFSYLVPAYLKLTGQSEGILAMLPSVTAHGADLWRFPSPDEAAVVVSKDGLGNYGNYGIRTTAVDDTGLYLGTANPTNIFVDADGQSLGGWELHRFY